MGKKKKPTRPKPIKPKRVRDAKPDWEYFEWLDWMRDIEERERKRKGPSEEALKLLNKKSVA